MSSEKSNTIDIVIPYHPKDVDIIHRCIKSCLKNISDIGRIYVITAEKSVVDSNVEIIDENSLFNGELTLKTIETKLAERLPAMAKRAGWFYQQFIKIGCSYAVPDISNYYLVVDSDVVFLKKICFFNRDRMLITRGREFHKPYFNLYEQLLGEKAGDGISFVAHHMLISRNIMMELLDKIETRFNTKWHDAILDNLNHERQFSEYETYGHYAMNHYPSIIEIKKRVNIQRFKMRHLFAILLNWADYATFHAYKRPQNNLQTNWWIYRAIQTITDWRIG